MIAETAAGVKAMFEGPDIGSSTASAAVEVGE
jgi:hypothetical protein